MKICPRCSDIYPDDATSCPKHPGLELRSLVDPLIGKTIGRYRLISRLGTGGMSSVYLARHVMIDRLAAIKTLRRDLARDPVQRDRFLREARAVNRINHENIVEITDFGETDDGLVYLVMEYVPGEPLFRALSGGPIAMSRAIHIARQAGSALGRAHQMGIIHRDLKPENIILVQQKDVSDFVKILDFGIAKILDAPAITGSQQIFGTPGYIAPEYIQHAQIDARSDLYSLGVILYEMVTGALPFDYEYPGDLLVKHVMEPPIAPSKRVRNLSPAVEAFVLRCLEKKPEARFRDAYHFVEELDALAERLGSEETWGSIADVGLAEDYETQRDHPTIQNIEVDRSLLEASAPSGEAATSSIVTPATGIDIENERTANRRPQTQSYGRPAIPAPPKPLEQTGPPAKEADEDFGVLGSKQWRVRFDSIRASLDELETHAPTPNPIVQAMISASAALEELEMGVADADIPHRRIQDLEEQARDFRATLGRAVDDRAGKLSHARGEREEMIALRDELKERRERARFRVRNGETTEGEADALLWELAAVEEKLRVQTTACTDLAYQLEELETQLKRKNESVESELALLNAQLAVLLAKAEPHAVALRLPLDAVEAYLREAWTNEQVESTSIDGKPPQVMG